MALAQGGELVRRQPPYDGGTSVVHAVWHGRDEHDVGHAWLRGLVGRTARVVEETLS